MLAIRQLATAARWAALLTTASWLVACGQSSPVTGNSTGASTSQPASSLTQIPATSAGAATLSWVAPTENADGTPITDLAGFRIYYGTSASALTQTIDVPDPNTTAYIIENLTAGTYFFAVTAYTTMGTESAQSSFASKTI